MRLDRDFLASIDKGLDGWLLTPAAELTAGIMEHQDDTGVAGPVLEIGVWRGKYLSLLHKLSTERVFGIDVFRYGNSEDEVYRNISSFCGADHRLQLFTSDSSDLSKSKIDSLLGSQKMRYISIDGSHEGDFVYHDLILAEHLLASGGVIALDDFINLRAIGVCEGAYRYFLTRNDGRLRPFAYCGNKLFISRADHQEMYRDAAVTFMKADPELEVSKLYKAWLTHGEHVVNLKLLGVQCLVLS